MSEHEAGDSGASDTIPVQAGKLEFVALRMGFTGWHLCFLMTSHFSFRAQSDHLSVETSSALLP